MQPVDRGRTGATPLSAWHGPSSPDVCNDPNLLKTPALCEPTARAHPLQGAPASFPWGSDPRRLGLPPQRPTHRTQRPPREEPTLLPHRPCCPCQ